MKYPGYLCLALFLLAVLAVGVSMLVILVYIAFRFEFGFGIGAMASTLHDILMNIGIFVLHMVQMAMFVVLPHALVDHGGLAAAEHWKVYLPALLLSFVLMIPAITKTEY